MNNRRPQNNTPNPNTNTTSTNTNTSSPNSNNNNSNNNANNNPNRRRPPNKSFHNKNRGHQSSQNPQGTRPHNPNANSNPNTNPNQQRPANGPLNIERIYEKYLNLLDQHLIARRKYHDLFFRADPPLKNKLERNFYATINDLRDFEFRLAPAARVLFEKRNNGLSADHIYTENHNIQDIGENPPPEAQWEDPHFLKSQKEANFSSDKEESKGQYEDYLKYKNF